MSLSVFQNPIFDLITIFLTLIFAGLTYISAVRQKNDTYEQYNSLSALVMVPCRGIDYSLEDNLRSLTAQDYPSFKIIAIVDSPEDPAVPVIAKTGIEWIVARDVCTNCSGKVRAISTAFEDYPEYDLYVIADSDIVVKRDWLSHLASPFGNEEVGISTTFPYFEPVGGFWSKVKLVWGFVGLGMMESSLTRFGWGGSLAFRNSLFQEGDLKFFKSYISDDIAITKICKKHGKSIAYVKAATPTVKSPDSFRIFIEWANRQTALSIYSTRKVYYYGTIFYGASIMLLLSGIILSVSVLPIFLIFLLPTAINAIRAISRAGRLPVLTGLISVIIPFLYMYNLLKASRMEKIRWRDREYSLKT